MRSGWGLGVVAILAAGPANASTGTITLEPLGWTADGRSFVYRQTSGTWTHVVIRDAVTLFDEVHLVEERIRPNDYQPPPPLESTWWATWSKSHPLVVTEGPVDGARVAGVRSTDFEVAADARIFRLHRKKPTGKAARGQVFLSVKGDPAGDTETKVDLAVAGTATLRMMWSPDHRRVAWVASPQDQEGECDGYDEERFYCRVPAVRVVAARPPRAVLVGEALTILRRKDDVLPLLDRAGLVVAGIRPADTVRISSVVYGSGEAARAAAAAMPGGASLEKLTWSEPVEVVVALGSSADALVSSPPARPGDLVAAGDFTHVSVLGWTKDDRYFAWKIDMEDESRIHVLDAATGNAVRYLVSISLDFRDLFLPSVATQRDQLTGGCEGCLTERAWQAWSAEHPLTSGSAERVSPVDATRVAGLRALKGGVAWKRQFLWTPPAGMDCADQTPLSGTVNGLELPLPSTASCNMGGDCSPTTVDPVWSPSGRRIAWVAYGGRQSMGHLSGAVMIGPTASPRVEMVADERLGDTSVLQAREAAFAAGYLVLHSGPADSPRKSSVVYAAGGYEADAAKLAAVVPGGASVEALTWKAKAQVIIALGESAR